MAFEIGIKHLNKYYTADDKEFWAIWFLNQLLEEK